MKSLVREWKAELEQNNMDHPYHVYTNVFGAEINTIILRTSYADVASWQRHRDELQQKFDMENMMSRWGEHVRDWEVVQSFVHPELSHHQ